MKIVDIKAIADIVHAYNPEIKVIVDNTFSSPYLQTPLTLGADVVVHSATKYLNGHGDVIAGFIVSDEDFIENCRGIGLKDLTGAVMSPFNAFLIERGLKTLDLRMERHCSNAEKLADYLRAHPAVTRVYYPGFEDFPGHEIAKKQMRRFGGMIAVEFAMSREDTAAAIDKLELCTLAVSLGDAETLVEQPATMTHNSTARRMESCRYSGEPRAHFVGLEDARTSSPILTALFLGGFRDRVPAESGDSGFVGSRGY